MRLTKRLIMRMVRLRAMVKLEKELSEDIRDEMKEREIDVCAPPTCPYKFVLREFDKTDVKWKVIAEAAYKEIYGTKFQEHLDAAVAAFGRRDECQLHIVPNEDYQKQHKKAA